MSDARVTSEFWVSAFRKRLEAKAISVFITKKGDKQSGAIIIKFSSMVGTSKIFVQGPSIDGTRRWIELMSGSDDQIEETIVRQKTLDRDAWILEVETISDLEFTDDDFLFN